MAGQLKEVRNRIKSVQSTQQITKAMKMVSAAKLRRAQDAIIQMRPYAKKMQEMLSNIVSNVPAVMLLKSVVSGLPNQQAAWLTLAMASTLAGNLTVTGSVANIIVVESARPEVEIGFREYFRAGLPITVATMIVGWAWLSWVR